MKKMLCVIVAVTLIAVASVSFGTTIKDGMRFEGPFETTNSTSLSGFALKVASIVMTGVDYTLSAAEALCNILIVTGSPSGKSIIAPTLTTSGASLLYTVRNAGSDSGTVTIKATGQTGVNVATGKTAEVYFLTDDYVRKTADATH
jgi:hypothetical protein